MTHVKTLNNLATMYYRLGKRENNITNPNCILALGPIVLAIIYAACLCLQEGGRSQSSCIESH